MNLLTRAEVAKTRDMFPSARVAVLPIRSTGPNNHEKLPLYYSMLIGKLSYTAGSGYNGLTTPCRTRKVNAVPHSPRLNPIAAAARGA